MLSSCLSEQDIAVRAVEFWNIIAEEESELGDVAGNRKYILTALAPLVSMLMELMTKQGEDDSEETYTISQAAANCLESVAGAAGDAVLGPVVPAIQSWFGSADWHQRDAATLAFGLIMVGPSEDALKPLISAALAMLLGKLAGPARDPSVPVRDTTAWTLGRIFDYQYGVLDRCAII
jgi:importin subunit beta-1